MTPQSKIAARANGLSRNIYASLPFKYRIARLLVVQLRLAGMLEASYGRLMYAEFIKAGVTDMPDVELTRKVGPYSRGEVVAAEDLREYFLAKGKQAVSFLPEKYGSRLGHQMWTISKSLVKSETNVQEVMQQVAVELTAGTKQTIKALPLSSAESYVKDRVKRRSIDLIRSTKRQSNPVVDKEISEHINISAPNAVHKLWTDLGASGRREIQKALHRDVDRRHPEWAWEWIEAQLEGLSNRDLAAQWGVAPSMVTQWVQRYLPAIRDVFEEFLGMDAASGY